MYQCLGLAKEQEGGCGEDWWHPECLLGLPRDWFAAEKSKQDRQNQAVDDGNLEKAQENGEDDHPVPPGFPDDEEFETVICYKCVDANPWIKRYANAEGFMSLKHEEVGPYELSQSAESATELQGRVHPTIATPSAEEVASKKRKAKDDESGTDYSASKKIKADEAATKDQEMPKHASLPPVPSGRFSIFAKDNDFRSRFCDCDECYKFLREHPQLLEEEETYEPPLSEDGDAQGGSVGTGSLLDRGEAALSNIDRVRAIGTFTLCSFT